MQVKVEDVSPVEKKLAVEIPWEHVRAKMNEAYRNLGKKVHLKGFRAGHVLREMLEKLYGKAVEGDVMRDLVRESFSLAAQENDLHPVADPIVDDISLSQGKPFRYSARFEVRTEFDPKDYDGLELDRRPPKATNEEIEQALEARRQSQVELKPIEGRTNVSDKDIVHLEIEGKVGDVELKKRDLHMDLTNELDPLPGLRAALIGLPTDAASHELTLEIPDSVPQAELKGKTAHIKVAIKQAREKVVPALDDEFAKDTGEADTLVELREKIREKILATDEKRIDRELREAAVKEICRRNDIPIAPALTERQLDVMIHRAQRELEAQGLDARKLDAQKLREDLRDSAKQEVRAALLLDAIGIKEKVEVTPQDLDKRVAELAQTRNQHPARVKADLQKNGQLAAIRYALREEKVLDLILSKATIKKNAEETISGA
jgi:trigger factor